MPKVYIGQVVEGEHVVLVVKDRDVKILKHQVRHSPDGFNWGYNGSGPADLALSILRDFFGPDTAGVFYTKFQSEIISKLPIDVPFRITEAELKWWIRTVN